MIILFVYFLGNVMEVLFKLPIPGTVLGLILLFAALYTRIIKIEMVEDICDVLISHMAFLFVPAGVGLITSLGILKGKVIQFTLIIIISTIVVWIVTAYSVNFLRRLFSHE